MATIQTINISSANDGLGDPLRTAFDKTNQNNTALNNDLATKAPLASPTITGTLTAVNDAIINGLTVGKGNGNLSSNLALGAAALLTNTTGYNNTAIGTQSLQLNTTGYENTALGNAALYNNTVFFNVTAIGSNSQASASNQVNLGNTNVNSLRCNVQVITSLSDKRDKKDILEISEGLEFIDKLKPVTFTWNQRDGGRVGIKSAGFIAQDLLELQNDSLIGENLDLVSDDNPDQLEARYANLMPIMIKAIQELKAEIELLKSK